MLDEDGEAVDWEIVEALHQECQKIERGDLFFPFFASCGACKGYVFRTDTDVTRQFGKCACVVAFEIESSAIQPPLAAFKAADCLLRELKLKHTAHPVSRAEQRHYAQVICARAPQLRTRKVLTTPMMTRRRLSKDRPRR